MTGLVVCALVVVQALPGTECVIVNLRDSRCECAEGWVGPDGLWMRSFRVSIQARVLLPARGPLVSSALGRVPVSEIG